MIEFGLPRSGRQQAFIAARDSGLVGDGTDESAKLAAAIARATALGGGTVVAQSGVFRVQNVTIPDGVTLAGAGMGATTFERVSTATEQIIAVSAGATLRDCTVDGRASVLYPDGVNSFLAEEVSCTGHVLRVEVLGAAHIAITQGGSFSTIESCRVIGDAAGDITRTISSISVANPTVITTTTPHYLVTGQDAKLVGTNSTPVIDTTFPGAEVTVIDATSFSVAQNVTVAGDAGTVGLDNGPCRYGIWSAGSTVVGARIIDNFVTNCYWAAIYLGGTHATVDGNTLLNNHQMKTHVSGGQLASTATGDGQHSITNNRIICDADHPAGSTGTTGIENTAVDVLISGNRIEGGGRIAYGIYLQGTAHGKVIGNNVRDCQTGIGVQAGTTDFTISDNFSGNVDETSQTHGILIPVGASDRYVITNNRMKGNTTADFTDGGTGSVKTIFGNLTTVSGNTLIPVNNLQFPAAAVLSTGVNVLDDYQEGSWTPTFGFNTPGDLSIVYSAQVGRYTKIGKRVFFNGLLTTSAFTFTTASGNAVIGGAPMQSLNLTGLAALITLAGRGWTKAGAMPFGQMSPNGFNIGVNYQVSGAAMGSLTAAEFTSGTQVEFLISGHYDVQE